MAPARPVSVHSHCCVLRVCSVAPPPRRAFVFFEESAGDFITISAWDLPARGSSPFAPLPATAAAVAHAFVASASATPPQRVTAAQCGSRDLKRGQTQLAYQQLGPSMDGFILLQRPTCFRPSASPRLQQGGGASASHARGALPGFGGTLCEVPIGGRPSSTNPECTNLNSSPDPTAKQRVARAGSAHVRWVRQQRVPGGRHRLRARGERAEGVALKAKHQQARALIAPRVYMLYMRRASPAVTQAVQTIKPSRTCRQLPGGIGLRAKPCPPSCRPHPHLLPCAKCFLGVRRARHGPAA